MTSLVRAAGVEPATFGFGGTKGVRPRPTKGSQVVGKIGGKVGKGVRISQSVACNRKPHGPPVVQVFRTKPRVRTEQLLTVRQLAAHLGVSTAHVYRLAERGELPHMRVGNAIRFLTTDLDFIVRARRPS
jgi:excisionase family DNA binding protein